jgi:hypothetical protein
MIPLPQPGQDVPAIPLTESFLIGAVLCSTSHVAGRPPRRPNGRYEFGPVLFFHKANAESPNKVIRLNTQGSSRLNPCLSPIIIAVHLLTRLTQSKSMAFVLNARGRWALDATLRALHAESRLLRLPVLDVTFLV